MYWINNAPENYKSLNNIEGLYPWESLEFSGVYMALSTINEEVNLPKNAV